MIAEANGVSDNLVFRKLLVSPNKLLLFNLVSDAKEDGVDLICLWIF